MTSDLSAGRATASPWLYAAVVCLIGAALLVLLAPQIAGRQAQLDRRRSPSAADAPGRDLATSRPAAPVAAALVAAGVACYGRFFWLRRRRPAAGAVGYTGPTRATTDADPTPSHDPGAADPP